MIGYLLDTNTVSRYHTGHSYVVDRVQALPADAMLYISAITVGEIVFGHYITVTTDQERRDDFERFIRDEFPPGRILQVTSHAARHYGDIKARLFRLYPPPSRRHNHPESCIDRVTGQALGIDENDLWIASQSVEHNLILVTNDEMRRIKEVAPEIDVEDWTQPFCPRHAAD